MGDVSMQQNNTCRVVSNLLIASKSVMVYTGVARPIGITYPTQQDLIKNYPQPEQNHTHY